MKRKVKVKLTGVYFIVVLLIISGFFFFISFKSSDDYDFERVTGNVVSSSDAESYFKNNFGIGLSNIYFGDLHSHTDYSLDAALISILVGSNISVSKNFIYGKTNESLSFAVASDHSEGPNYNAEPFLHKLQGYNLWKSMIAIAKKYNKENSGKSDYILFPSYEYSSSETGSANVSSDIGSSKGYGHKIIIFKELNGKMPQDIPSERFTIWNKTISKADTFVENVYGIYAGYDKYKGNVLVIPHTVSSVAGKIWMDWESVNSDFIRVVETCSMHGNFEGRSPANASCSNDYVVDFSDAAMDNNHSMRNMLYEYWIKKGNPKYTFGFIGSTDNHIASPGIFSEISQYFSMSTKPTSSSGSITKITSDEKTYLSSVDTIINLSTDSKSSSSLPGGETIYPGAVVGIVAKNLTRDNLWSGLWNKHTITTKTSKYYRRLPLLFGVEANGKNYLMGDWINSSASSIRLIAVTKDATKIDIILDGCLFDEVNQSYLDKTIQVDSGRHFVYVRAYLPEDVNNTLVSWSSPVYIGNAA